MNGRHLLIALSYIDRKFIEESECDMVFEKKQNAAARHRANIFTKRTMKRSLLIAAIVSLLLLLVGCTVVYVLSMQKMKLGETQVAHDVFSENSGEYQGKETVTQQVLTFAGVRGTTNYKAAQEWFDFLRTYDPDEKIYASVWKDVPDFPAAYSSYLLYTQEMKDTLDSILEKYKLKPLGESLEFHTIKSLYTALGIEKLVTNANDVKINIMGGYVYENGNFMLALDIRLPDDTESKLTQTKGHLNWYRKDCFSADNIYLDDIEQWQEWNYTTEARNEVLIIRSSSDWRGWIICDCEEAMLVLRLETRVDLGGSEDGSTHWGYLEMTNRQMELIADAIDFGIRPGIATREDLDNWEEVSQEDIPNDHEEVIEKNPVETLEFVTKPIDFKTIGGYTEDAEGNRENLYESWTVTSFTLGPDSATIVGCPVFRTPQDQLEIYMKDGSSVLLFGKSAENGASQLTSLSKVDLAQVDYILLADGTMLYAPDPD